MRLALLTLAAAVAASARPNNPNPSSRAVRGAHTKRCSPVYDPDLALGYDPPAPCWQTFDPACRPFLAEGTEMTLDAPHRLAVVYGVSQSCRDQIAEELAREARGQKNYGWVREHGTLTVLPGEEGILVISDMPPAAVERYAALTYMSWP